MSKVMKDNDTSQINPNKLKCLALGNRHLQQYSMLHSKEY
jgi:hypothetical protein